MTAELTEEKASEIYQDLLDRICDAYFVGDFPAFKTAIHTPHTYSTEEKQHRIENDAQMEQAFNCFRDYLQGMGVTDFIRECTGAAFLAPNRIIGGHKSELLRNGTRLREPYTVWATLELLDGVWKVTSSEIAIADTAWQSVAFRQGAAMTDAPQQPRTE